MSTKSCSDETTFYGNDQTDAYLNPDVFLQPTAVMQPQPKALSRRQYYGKDEESLLPEEDYEYFEAECPMSDPPSQDAECFNRAAIVSQAIQEAREGSALDYLATARPIGTTAFSEHIQSQQVNGPVRFNTLTQRTVEKDIDRRGRDTAPLNPVEERPISSSASLEWLQTLFRAIEQHFVITDVHPQVPLWCPWQFFEDTPRCLAGWGLPQSICDNYFGGLDSSEVADLDGFMEASPPRFGLYDWQRSCLFEYFKNLQNRENNAHGLSDMTSTSSFLNCLLEKMSDEDNFHREAAYEHSASESTTSCNLLYSAPTGGGKTLVAEMIMLRCCFGIPKGVSTNFAGHGRGTGAKPVLFSEDIVDWLLLLSQSESIEESLKNKLTTVLTKKKCEPAVMSSEQGTKVMFIVPYVALAEEKAAVFERLIGVYNSTLSGDKEETKQFGDELRWVDSEIMQSTSSDSDNDQASDDIKGFLRDLWLHCRVAEARRKCGNDNVSESDEAEDAVSKIGTTNRFNHYRAQHTRCLKKRGKIDAGALSAAILNGKRVQCHAGKKGHRSLSHDILVCTTEKANILLNVLIERKRSNELACVVVDEVHQIREQGRGYVLELLLTKLIALSAEAHSPILTPQKSIASSISTPAIVPPSHTLKVIGMSATLSNAPTLCKWMKEALLFVTDFRPIPLKEHYVIQGQVFSDSRGAGMAVNSETYPLSRTLPLALHGAVNDKPLLQTAMHHKAPANASWAQQQAFMDRDLQILSAEGVVSGFQVLVFCPSRASCETGAAIICNGLGNLVDWPSLTKSKATGGDAFAPDAFAPPHASITRHASARKALLKQLKVIPVSPNGSAVVTLAGSVESQISIITLGVAFHHAALTGDERSLVEKAYRAGALWCLCCTTTLATGVNLPTRRVIFRSVKIADQYIDSGQYRQAAGRAGRKGLDTLGESYILCKPAERVFVENQLLAASLPPIISNFSIERKGMVRVLLEGIATGAVRNVTDIQKSVEGTLLAATLSTVSSGGDMIFTTAKSALEFLEQNRFIDWNTVDQIFTITALGEATVTSGMAPDEAILLFRDLSKARKCISVDHHAEDLQLLFLCTPYFHGVEPNWGKFYSEHYSRIPSEVRQQVCASLLGIEEGRLFQWEMVPPKQLGGGKTRISDLLATDLTLLAYKRFYVTLILWDIIREVPHATICSRYQPLSRAELLRLTDLASNFAMMTSSFTTSLGWWFFPPLFETMAARLSVGVEPDLLPLMKIEGLSAKRARELAKKGYRTPLAVACATTRELEAILSKRAPFTMGSTTTLGLKRPREGEGDTPQKTTVDLETTAAVPIAVGDKCVLAEKDGVTPMYFYQLDGKKLAERIIEAAKHAVLLEAKEVSDTAAEAGIVVDVPQLTSQSHNPITAPQQRPQSHPTVQTSVSWQVVDCSDEGHVIFFETVMKLILFEQNVPPRWVGMNLARHEGHQGNLMLLISIKVDDVGQQKGHTLVLLLTSIAAKRGSVSMARVSTIVQQTVLSNPNATLVLYDVKSQLHSWYSLGFLPPCWPAPTADGAPLASHLICKLFDLQVADWILEPEDRANSRWAGLDQLCNFHKISFEGIGSLTHSLDKDPTLSYKKLPIPEIQASENSVLSCVITTVSPFVANSEQITFIDEEKSAILDPLRQFKLRDNVGNESDVVSKNSIDKFAQKQRLQLLRQGCAMGVKLCNAATSLSQKMRQFERRGALSDAESDSDEQGTFEPASLLNYFYSIEMKLTLVLLHMELAGVAFDPNNYEFLATKMKARGLQLISEAYSVTEQSNWHLSNVKDCATMLFDVQKMPCLERTFDAKFLPARLQKSAARGKGRGARVAAESRSTKATVLNGLIKLFPANRLPYIIKEYRTMDGWIEKYLRPLIGLCVQDDDEAGVSGKMPVGRIYGEFLQTATATGRLSMNEPNLQTIPHPITFTMDSGEKVDACLRQAYIATPCGTGNTEEWVLLSADYAQIEARLLAHFSKDAQLLSAFNDEPVGEGCLDVFERLATQIFSLQCSDSLSSVVTPGQRKAAKTLCYGMIYGKGAASIADDVEISLDEATTLLGDFKRTYQTATTFIENLGSDTGAKGFVSTILGRRRWLPYAGSSNPRHKAASDRVAINTLCQGSAADIIKLAMVKLVGSVRAGSVPPTALQRSVNYLFNGTEANPTPRARLLLQIHDELVFEARRSDIALLAATVASVMDVSSELKLRVRLPVRVKVGANWNDLTPLEINFNLLKD